MQGLAVEDPFLITQKSAMLEKRYAIAAKLNSARASLQKYICKLCCLKKPRQMTIHSKCIQSVEPLRGPTNVSLSNLKGLHGQVHLGHADDADAVQCTCA